MNRVILIVFCCFLTSCKNSIEYDILYKQLLNYRNELKMDIKSQEEYLYNSSRENIFLKRRFDSLNKINAELEKSFGKMRYGERNKIIELRNKYNTKHKLRIEFENSTYDENISDSIFNRIIEIDIYRLRKEFQNKLMFISKEGI